MAKSSKKKQARSEDPAIEPTESSDNSDTTPRKRSSKKSQSGKKSSTKQSKSSAKQGQTSENEARSTTKRSASGSKRNKSSKHKRPGFVTWLRFALACLAVLIALLAYFFDLSRVSSNAMMPTLAKGDLVLSFAPWFVDTEVTPGQIALIRNDQNEAAPNFLRVIASHGETITYDADRLSVNGIAIPRVRLTNAAIARPADEPDIWRESIQDVHYKISLPQRSLAGALSGSVQLTEQKIFLAGDNRMASYDSRQAGPTEKSQIRGHALIILESMRNDGVLGHWLKLIDL